MTYKVRYRNRSVLFTAHNTSKMADEATESFVMIIGALLSMMHVFGQQESDTLCLLPVSCQSQDRNFINMPLTG